MQTRINLDGLHNYSITIIIYKFPFLKESKTITAGPTNTIIPSDIS